MSPGTGRSIIVELDFGSNSPVQAGSQGDEADRATRSR